MGSGNLCKLLVGKYIGAATVENSMEHPQKLQNRTPIWPSNSTLEYISQKNENTNSKIYMHPNVHCNTIYSRQDMDATQVSINRQTD